MENKEKNHKENEKAIITVNDKTLELSPQDVRAIAERADNIISTLSHALTSFGSTAVQIKNISADVDLEFARINQELDALMIKSQRDIRIYEESLPVLDKHFTICQERMDKLMERAMDLISSDTSDGSIAKQETVLKMIETANSSLTALIAKLIPNY